MPDPPKLPHPGGTRGPAALKRLRNDSTFRRRILLGAGAAAIAVTVPATAILTSMALSSNADTADRLAAAGDVLVGATLLLAVAAALVALRAYAVTTGTPDLKLQVLFEFSSPNNPVFKASASLSRMITAYSFKQLSGGITIRNDSGYPGRNPAVIVRLQSMVFTSDSPQFDENWAVTGFSNTNGITAVQWDGGPSYSIHGHSTRRLPMLYLNNLRWMQDWGTPALIVEILADSFRKVVYLPVDFTINDESQVLKEDQGTVSAWL